MTNSTIATYVGALISIAFGAALLWAAPASIAGQAATIGAAFSFITAGLAAFGVASVVVPAAIRQAARAAQPPKAAKPK